MVEVAARPSGDTSRFLKGLLIYVALGPPIGGVVFWLLPVILFHSGQALGGDLLTLALMFSYVVGLIPSAIVGAIVAFLNVRYRGLNWAHVGAIGLVPALAILAGKYITPHPHNVRPDEALGEFLAWAWICVIPTLVCWCIVRRWRIQHEGV